jgi:hypothetical protein
MEINLETSVGVCLFIDGISSSDHREWNSRAGRHNKLERKWKEWKAVSQHLLEGTDENHESLSQDIQYDIRI